MRGHSAGVDVGSGISLAPRGPGFGAMRWLSPGGAHGRLTVFIFHRVLDAPDPLRPSEPDRARFEQIVRFIARRFRVLPLADAAAALSLGRVPAAAACITFDDGYADNLLLAAPILLRYGVTATVFVSTAFSDGSRMWNDSVIEAVRALPVGMVDWREFGLGVAHLRDDESRRALIAKALPRLKYLPLSERAAVSAEMAQRAGVLTMRTPMLTPAQLKAWRALGFDVGGHTIRHPILARLTSAEAAAEIGGGREQLTEWLGEAPRAFAYPNGVPGRDYGARDVALVRSAGYACAVTTAAGVGRVSTNVYELPRFTPWDRSMAAFGLRCARMLIASRSAAAAVNIDSHQEVSS
jgi:peptidoglycan/xylan/chitin deacetylase (PgdA/CDA1 family)